jgi:hypothetical protein
VTKTDISHFILLPFPSTTVKHPCAQIYSSLENISLNAFFYGSKPDKDYEYKEKAIMSQCKNVFKISITFPLALTT